MQLQMNMMQDNDWLRDVAYENAVICHWNSRYEVRKCARMGFCPLFTSYETVYEYLMSKSTYFPHINQPVEWMTEWLAH